MQEENLLFAGLQLMAFGMGTVLVFLVFLIAAMSLLSFFVSLLAKPEQASNLSASMPSQHAQSDNGTLLAIITAAIHKHRSSRSLDQ